MGRVGVAPRDDSGSSNAQASVDCQARHEVERIVDYRCEIIVASSQQTYCTWIKGDSDIVKVSSRTSLKEIVTHESKKNDIIST